MSGCMDVTYSSHMNVPVNSDCLGSTVQYSTVQYSARLPTGV